MGEESEMAGANCKRFLQSKLGDRKRRRPNSVHFEPIETVDERVVGDSTNRLRHTVTRQSTQRLLIAPGNNTILAKPNSSITANPNKKDTRIQTNSSKKYLRSRKNDSDQFSDYEDIKKQCSPEYENMDKTERSTMYLTSGNDHSLDETENENYEINTNLTEKAFEENKIGENSDNEEECLTFENNNKNNESKEIEINLEINSEIENENASYGCRSIVSTSTSGLLDLNENSQVPSSSNNATKLEIEYNKGLGKLEFENHDKCAIEEVDVQNSKKEIDLNNKNKSETDIALPMDFHKKIGDDDERLSPLQNKNYKNENICRQISNFSCNVNKQECDEYENNLSHLSNKSICSENSSSFEDPSCIISTENLNKDFADNETDKPLGQIIHSEQSQKHIFKSANVEMNSNSLNSTKYLQNTMNINISTDSQRDEQCHYNVDGNEGCATETSSTVPPINIASQETSNSPNAVNLETKNSEIQEQYMENESCTQTSPDTNENIMQKKDISLLSDKQSSNIKPNDENNDNKNNCPTSTDHTRHDSDDTETIDNTDNLQENLKNRQQENGNNQDQNDDKILYLEKTSPGHGTEFETQTSDRITHQQQQQEQLEKDIIDAADKVYTQIEEQYHHHEIRSLSSNYGQIISNHHQQHQQSPQDQEESLQRHDVAVHTEQLQPPLQHPMQQQQNHYSAEQLYQLQQQEHHQQQLHMHQQHMQKQEVMHQQHNLARNQNEDHRQQHSHIMDFLHPQHHHPNSSNTHSPLHQQQQQQQQHIHEVYHDLMMDEFHEEHNTPYKLGLSPSTVKHENQDDGYETSAGDVLTPNSHASSTHSVTPQHQMQHSGGLIPNVVKCEDQQQHHNMRIQQQSQHNTHVINDSNHNIPQELIHTSESSTTNVNPRDPYHFIDDDLNSANSNSLRNILTPPHSHTRNNQDAGTINGFLPMQSNVSAAPNLSSDMYALTNSAVHQHHHHTQKQSCLDSNETTTRTSDHQQHFAETSGDMVAHDQDSILNLHTKSIQKRRGRKKKIPEGCIPTGLEMSNPNDVNSITGLTKAKERKKHDRFNGMSEEEVVKRILPDHLCDNLDIVIIGINPGLFAAYKGHHYAGPGNHFWKCLYLSGLTQEQMNADEDFKLIKYGIGFTNMVQRATKGSADLTRKEIKEGCRILLEKLQRFRPKIAVFNGKLIFEVFSGKKDFNFGRQPECVEGTDTFIWVMPSSSARCAQLPRAADKVPFYAALKKFRDYLNGLIPHIDQSECVFTEERIKQQCEQENYKNQQSSSGCDGNESTYQNAVGGANSNNTLQNAGSYPFDGDTNTHGACEGPGPPANTDNNTNNSFMMSSLVGNQHEKKKRGRPKKIKGQEMIDPVTGNKIQVPAGSVIGSNSGDYSNILNLSVVPGNNSEMPKKKRGRPKKVKPPHSNMLQQDIAQTTSMLSQKPNIMSIQSLTNDQGSPHHMQGMQTNHQHVAMYSTPPPTHQRSIYSPMPSPMASPSLNCSYTTNTPPSQPHHDKLGLPSNNGRDSTKTTSTELVPSAAHHQHSIQEQNFGESPPPSSPNICAVDFEPPTASTTSSIVSENVNTDLTSMHQRLHGAHQRSRYNSPISGEATPDHNANEHFQQWLSPQPNHNIHSPAAATSTMFANSPQQSSLNYHDQQQQQQIQQHQDIHPQWALRHQSRYEDLGNSPYMLGSQLHQTHTHATHNSNQNQHSSSSGSGDVARKSLSGLESLVDQIPTISESESIALSSAAAVNAQVAAAAAVESRLQGMQNASLTETQVGEDNHFSSVTGSQNILTASNSPTSATPANNNNQIQQSSTTTSNLLNSNFSVSNLAASSASNNNHDNYGLSSNARTLANPNAYHHSNLMAAAVLAAAAANTPTNLSTPSAAAGATNHHTSMYMDPHAHLTTHVPVNPMYPTAAPPPTHHHHHHSAVAAHHHHAAAAAHHYGSAQHAAADYATTNNPYATGQNNVATGHTLHMPSPNYPYGYTTASSQSNYSTYPHSHHANHHHGHPHAHHLAMFDRLKPSDITGYSSGF